MVFGKEVTLQTHGLDKYKRTLADVLLPERQSLAGQSRLVVVVVSEVCAGGYRAGRVGEGIARVEERLVGWSDSCTAVGMAKGEQVSGAWRALQRACSLVFAICSVSEVTPTFIPVVLETEARKAQKGLW